MTEALTRLVEQVATLRTGFDRGFVMPHRPTAARTEDLLALQVGPDPYAVRLSGVAGLFVDRRVTRVPADVPSLLGIAGFRGTIMPVYSLPILLGQTPTKAPRWLIILAAVPVAVAFDRFEGHLRAAFDTILPQQAHAQMHEYAPDFVRGAETVRPVLHLPSIVAAFGGKDSPPSTKSEKK
jgi:purine-binding chemotaxis protein CheW